MVGGGVSGDGDASEYGILDVGVGVVVLSAPLDDVGHAGLDGGGGQEVEGECAGLCVEAGVTKEPSPCYMINIF